MLGEILVQKVLYITSHPKSQTCPDSVTITRAILICVLLDVELMMCLEMILMFCFVFCLNQCHLSLLNYPQIELQEKVRLFILFTYADFCNRALRK